jgi:hypothetical protein
MLVEVDWELVEVAECPPSEDSASPQFRLARGTRARKIGDTTVNVRMKQLLGRCTG